ncbi:MAG: dihydrolipoyl dehydrogenase [bacterium]|nr:dihydrolipoyl dehydrogenase [bacterium]
MADTHDLIIIGGGPGGYVAAERAGAAGKNVLLIERAHLGGTCLNAGCIPTNTLLHSAKLYSKIQNASHYGVHADNARFDLAEVMGRKRRVIQTLRNGVAYQMARHHVTVRAGEAAFVDRQTVQIEGDLFTAPNIIIATGAHPVWPDVPGIEHAVTTTQLLDRETLPAEMVILGAGPLAVGLAAIYGMIGVKVSLVSPEARLLPDHDSELVHLLLLELHNVTLHLESDVQRITPDSVTAAHKGHQLTLPADTIVICGQRVPNVEGLGLEHTGLDYSAAGILVDEQQRTNLPGVYAIGDVTGRAMWAHAASRMAEVAVNHLLGIPDRFRVHAMPSVVYSDPEIASVGLTADQATAQGFRVKVGRLPLSANGRWVIENEGRRGLCKVVVDADTGRLLGVHLLAPNAPDLIFGAAAMLEDEFRTADLKQVLFAHPTVSEILKDSVYELR